LRKLNYLKKQLADAERRRQLLLIESRLIEHTFPPQVVIENTSYCNLKCIHCSHKEMLRPQRHMPRWLWNKIVEEIARESPECEVWPTFYGEALILGEELWDRLSYAAQAGCRNLVLNSNGTLLARKNNIDKVLRSPLKRFILSLDGLSKEIFEKIRFKAKWEQVYPVAVELCRRRLEQAQKYPVIIAQFSVMKENVDEFEDYCRYWKTLGAEVKVRPMLEWTATGSIRSDSIEHGSDFRIACPWGNNTMAIHQNGEVVTCAVDYEGRFTAGNVRYQSIGETWQYLRKTLRQPQRDHGWDTIPEICKGCGDWQVAGADYEEESIEGTRPFWYYEQRSIRSL
jgi:radical SAM protein with 4Fe4S-binding SPASM domain